MKELISYQNTIQFHHTEINQNIKKMDKINLNDSLDIILIKLDLTNFENLTSNDHSSRFFPPGFRSGKNVQQLLTIQLPDDINGTVCPIFVREDLP